MMLYCRIVTFFAISLLFLCTGGAVSFASTSPFDLLDSSLLTKTTEVVPTYCHALFGPQKIPEKFASPVNVFSVSHEILITTLCYGRDSVMVRVGNGSDTQYIYKYGREKIDGEWRWFTFSGSKTSGTWIIGEAFAELSGIKDGEKGEVAAYICHRFGDSWKCGCSSEECEDPKKWYIQEYELSKELYSFTNSFIPSEIPQKYLNLDKPGLDIYYASEQIGLVGSKILLTGVEFSTKHKNEVLWNGVVREKNLSSVNGTDLEITVPNLPPQKYEIKIRVGDIVSEYGVDFWIQNPKRITAPKIISISPEFGKQGGQFTIYGEGFTDSNDIVTTFGIIEDVSSKDGKSMTFSYDPFPEKLEAWVSPGVRYNYTQPVNVNVENTSGVSNLGTFNLEI